ncbi:MAG: HAD family phosphatase [Bacteroidetes bacterium]|nr:HAD family phosphatase [Bacteroidota bacterium]
MIPEAVIFDFDGVIADTMGDNCRAWQKAFKSHGFDMSATEYYRLEGMGRFQIAEHFIEAYGLDPAIKKEVVEAKELNYKLDNSFKIYPGIPAIFKLLNRKNIPIAIVTGASRDRIREHLTDNIAKNLASLITADDVTHTKPHPEPYLKAVMHMHKKADQCIVVENAILGIQSAKAAGCRCFGIETTLDKSSLALADEVFATHQELLIKFETILH